MESLKPAGRAIYKAKDGIRVPGVTTIIDIMSKPQLITWANKKGLEGIDTTKYVDDLADVGIVAHHTILCKFKGVTPDLSDFSANQIMTASSCLLSFMNWASQYKIEPLLVEEPQVSETLRCGGTPDLVCNLEGVPTLVDFKTGRALHVEVILQLGAYTHILEENGWAVEQARVLRIGREAGEGFEVFEVPRPALDLGFLTFMSCLNLYSQMKEVRKNYWKG